MRLSLYAPRHGERNDRTRAAGSSAAWGRRIFHCGERAGGAIEDKLSPPRKNKNPQKPHKLRIPRHPATQSALIWPGIPGPSGH
ncbi:hypothetical protein FA132_23900, partial [Pseudomonas aeruginosa]|nr:hypothetical protein [Pseudomonas aeruginosa]